MDEFNRKTTNCYYITNEVILKYKILYKVIVDYVFEDSSLYESYVDNVTDLAFR